MIRAMHSNRDGFTLVEILTVIAIIAVLAAILAPVLVIANNRSVIVGCTSNLRQIGQAFSMYTADYAGHYPPDPGLDSATDQPFWFQMLSRYTAKKDDIFWCKAVSRQTPFLAGDLSTPYPAAYSYNILLATSSTSAQYTATRVAVVDGTTNFSFYLNNKSVGYLVSPRHGNGWNVLYVDGHVRLRTSRSSIPDAGYHWEQNPPSL